MRQSLVSCNRMVNVLINFFKRLIPTQLLQRYRKYRYAKKNASDNLSSKEIFTKIYQTNQWQGEQSVSGKGSDDIQTQTIIKALNALLSELDISTVLDIPCGDFQWMKSVDLSGVTYIGADIVEELIEQNSTLYSAQHLHFKCLDLVSDPLPKADLVIVRDCFVHLSYKDVFASLHNIQSSGSTYLLTTSFPKHHPNFDIPTGSWRTLNLALPPFSFSNPLKLINENCTEDGGEFRDKSLALYEVKDFELTR